MDSEAPATATTRTSVTRLESVSAQASVAGCVAVVLFAIVSAIGWPTSGADAEGLERIAFSVPTVFAIAFAVRGLGALPFTQPGGVGRTVLMDVGVVTAALLFVGVVGSVGSSSGIATYSAIIMAMFLVPITAVASLAVEIARRVPWLTRVVVVGAVAAGVAALSIYASGITG